MSKHMRRHRGASPHVDPEFAQALDGDESRSSSGGRHDDHKALHLCRQVQRALTLALGERCVDPALDALYVVDVTPLSGCGHLLVHVAASGDLANVLTSLRLEGPRLRSAVARAINRKRAPELSFVLASADGGRDV